MIAYVDTSAIVKLVVPEEGSDEADSAWNSAERALTSRITYAESRAALAAARRDGRLSPEALGRAKHALERRFEALDLIEASPDVVRSAGDLAEEHGLRGYDAVHLASALSLQAPDLVLVTWDDDLAPAGRAMGLALAGTRLN